MVLAACGESTDDATSDAEAPAAEAGDAETSATGTAGGSSADGDTATEPSNPAPVGESTPGAEPAGADAETAPDADPGAAPVGSSAGLVDLVGPDVVAASEIETNELPDVVVDDVSTGRQVNFRNLVPQDKPILLWMWAPH